MSGARRTDLPRVLHGSISWSDTPLAQVDGIIRLLHSQPALMQRLLRGATPPSEEGGRPRLPGEWPTAFLVFLASGQRDFLRWWRDTDDSLWQRMEFRSRPLYDTVYHHFTALEEHPEAFHLAATELIQRAVRQSHGAVGKDVHVDGTEAETNARLYHDCQEDDDCSRRTAGHSPAAKAPVQMVREDRQKEATQAPTNDPQLGTDGADLQPGRIQLSNGCWYRTCDATAGVRSYKGPRGARKFWHGFNCLKAIDHYTGGVLSTHVISASENEHQAYPTLLNRVIEKTGFVPRAAVGDRGFSVASVFEMNTRMGIASVFPYRKSGSEAERRDHDRFDRHGIPRCKHCDGETRFVSFERGTGSNPEPRLFVMCADLKETECNKRQTIYCREGWRHLLPLWRTTEAYMALRNSHGHYETAHWRWRDRFLVGGDSTQTRPRRRGIACQILRAEAALLLEWLNICYREGWLGNARENQAEPFEQHAEEAVAKVRRSRHLKGLHLPASEREAHLQALETHKVKRRSVAQAQADRRRKARARARPRK